MDFAIEMKGITKAYGACRANDMVDLRVRPGTIHGLIGENGAGKSTLMKILYGMTPPTSGTISINGNQQTFLSSSDAIAAGLGMVHQHFMLVPTLTNLDNLILGFEPTKGISLNRKDAKARFEQIAKQLNFEIRADEITGEMTVGSQQRLEIMKLLYRKAKIIILDEPTAVLTPQETDELFLSLQKLKAEGHTIVIITHKLKEILAITDEVTVLRQGRSVGSTQTKDTNQSQLAEWMVGRPVLFQVEKTAAKPENKILEFKSVEYGKFFGPIDFQLRRGEILGIAGVDGNGQRELAQLISGVIKPTRGTVSFLEKDISQESVQARRLSGITHIAEDRHNMGSILPMTVQENVLLGWQMHPELSSCGWIQSTKLKHLTEEIIKDYDVRPTNAQLAFKSFSGGNQQKIVVGREMSFDPKLLIAAQPTRGVDIGAIELIHRRLIAARDTGVGVLLVSTELEEILSLADRIIVLYRGKIAGELDRKDADEKKLGILMAGGKP